MNALKDFQLGSQYITHMTLFIDGEPDVPNTLSPQAFSVDLLYLVTRYTSVSSAVTGIVEVTRFYGILISMLGEIPLLTRRVVSKCCAPAFLVRDHGFTAEALSTPTPLLMRPYFQLTRKHQVGSFYINIAGRDVKGFAHIIER